MVLMAGKLRQCCIIAFIIMVLANACLQNRGVHNLYRLYKIPVDYNANGREIADVLLKNDHALIFWNSVIN